MLFSYQLSAISHQLTTKDSRLPSLQGEAEALQRRIRQKLSGGQSRCLTEIRIKISASCNSIINIEIATSLRDSQ